MTYKQFVHMYHNSGEMRSRVTRWLLSNPPPDEIDPLKWALSEFIGSMVMKETAGKGIRNQDQFTVSRDDILAEALGRKALGEDAGAAFNEDMGVANIQRAKDAHKNPGKSIRWEGDKE